MNGETGSRTLIVRPDGGVSVLAAHEVRRGASSVDAWLSRAEAKAAAALPGSRIHARLAAGDLTADRRLRDAWRVDAETGALRVDIAAARALKARAWAREADQLRTFIERMLLPEARMLAQTDTVARLERALDQIAGAIADVAPRIATMTLAELASYTPPWPTLSSASTDPIP